MPEKARKSVSFLIPHEIDKAFEQEAVRRLTSKSAIIRELLIEGLQRKKLKLK